MSPKLQFTCSRCGRRYRNPLAHVCAPRSDFKRRVSAAERAQAAAGKRQKAAAQRARETDARRARRAREDAARRGRREREKAAAKRRKAPASRPARPQHRYSACRDRDCERTACEAYRDGYAEGFSAGVASAEGN